MKYKRHFIIILIAIVIYVILTIVYNNIILKSDEKIVFISKEDIAKGSEISIEKFESVILKNIDTSLGYITDLSKFTNTLANFDIKKGQIIIEEMIISKDKYIKSNNDEELVSIKIKNSEDCASYNIGKNSIVNIYYTGKFDLANEILKDLNTTNVISGGNPGYITTELLKNIKITNVYDKYGNEININSLQSNNEILVDTIIISTNSKMAMNIYNLSRYGEFSLSILK